MHGYAERSNWQSRIEADLALEADLAPETDLVLEVDLAPWISDQLPRWHR